MGWLRALLWLIQAQLLRIAREGLVVRALAWPGLLTALTLAASSAVVLAFYADKAIAIEPGHPEIVQELQEKGLQVQEVGDPQALLETGEVPRAAWTVDHHWHLGTLRAGRLTLTSEATLRQHIDANWLLRTPKPGGRPVELRATVRVLMGMLGVLFALYGVVFGAASLSRDRADGSLEAELALPVPRALHSLARTLSATLALGVGVALTVGLLDAMLGVQQPGAWIAAVSLAGVTTTALGQAWMSAVRGESLTGPLSRGMTLALGGIALGFRWPELGRHLPLASLGSMVKNQSPSPLAWALTLAVLALSCWVFARRTR